ncbi:chemotaxis protein [Desulfovibrio psychrotolerans]|uniref:Chemotaxis protein CheV n=1 Tax=Desulfovibrio psychrotolerans TaxID=415242 RepID=A0A7J0BWU9_9BACT|nr:chemotaxis protein [Desulfovibrio psychrotolerans]GFM38178.1 chemotaxis protein CheV [Desulfovibrio psychrotolerans]
MQTNILLESGTNELEIVEFFLDESEADGSNYRGYYGVNVAKVLEIIRMPSVTELPEGKHTSVLGAFNLRNHIIPLVDLARWLNKNRGEVEPPKVIVTEFNNVCTAFQVSGVNRIHRISWEAVEPPNRYVSSLSNYSITGVVKIDDRIIFLLDLEKIVADLNPALGLRLDEAIDWSANVRYRAIIADDSGLIREMLRDLMEKANFEVEAMTNGREAWDRLVELKAKAEAEQRSITDYVQVMVSDIEMPSMDGHNLCKRIKEDPQLRKLPVILFSSLITDKLRHKGDAVGADDQVSKPEVTHLAQRALALIEAAKEE